MTDRDRNDRSLLSTLVESPKPPQSATPASPPPAAPIRDDSGHYVDIVPYHADDDPNARFFLPWMWQKLYDDGLIDLYFPGSPEKSFADFVKLMSGNTTRVVLVVLKDPSKPKDADIIDVIGFSTWEPSNLGPVRTGICGFIFLKRYWDRVTSLAAGKRILHFWFDEMPEDARLDMFLGLIASTNRPANLFVQRLGWTRSGLLPGCHQYDGQQADAILWTITREQFEKVSQ